MADDRTCAECGVAFRPRHKTSSYCSVPCARKKNGGHNIKMETWWENGNGYIEGKVLTAQGHRNVKQHRFVMECSLGRRLLPCEDVHHINGNKADNRPENLELLSHSAHSTLTNSERTYTSGKRIRLSADEIERRRQHMAGVGRKYGAANLAKARAALAKARGEQSRGEGL